MYPYILQGKNLVIVIDNTSHTVNPSHIAYEKIINAIKTNDWGVIKDLVEPRKIVLKFARGHVSIDGEQLFWKGQPLHNSLSSKIIAMFKEGFSIDPMVNFIDNLMQNPSHQAVNELYGFLEASQLPITPDGHFLAFKKVGENYKDIYTQKVDNSIGARPRMDRNMVDDDRNRTCSKGLHFCSKGYLPHYGSSVNNHIMIVKINPRDVVSIPSDYNNAKGRCCEYQVVGELGKNRTPDTAFSKAVHDQDRTVDGQTAQTGPAAAEERKTWSY